MRLRPKRLSQPRHTPGPTRRPGPKPGDPPPGRTHGSHQALRPEGPDGPRQATRRPKTVRGRPPGRLASRQVIRNGLGAEVGADGVDGDPELGSGFVVVRGPLGPGDIAGHPDPM